MPPIYPLNNNMLRISLGERNRYHAGATITGTVTRAAHFVDPDATLTIKFLGRAKVKIVIARGQGTATYRSRYIFWNNKHPPVSAILHKGPVHVPPGLEEPQSWPFAITIPTSIPESTIYQEESDATYLKPGDPETVELPGSFTFTDDSFWGNNAEAYVDYHLQAILQDSKGHSCEAIVPIMIHGPSSPIPITDFGVRSFRGKMMAFHTHRLVPGLAQAKLSFSQKAQHVFGSSKVPMFVIQVVANTPSVLQLGNPSIIPFQVQGSMIKDRTSEILHDVQPTIVITKFELTLTAITKVIAPGNFNTYDEKGETSWIIASYAQTPQEPHPATPTSPSPASAGGSSKGNTGSKGSSKADKVTRVEDLDSGSPPDANTLILPMEAAPFPLDLGQALQIRVPTAIKNARLSPSFRTFNIHNTHTLEWELAVEVAGKDAVFCGKHAVNVMPPSEDALPAYAPAE
ncbi:hypothetical protein CC79DRAFT_1370074 [Sarocladium strictum]